jgi:hypothetical protein
MVCGHIRRLWRGAPATASAALGFSYANLLHNSETGHGLRPHPSFLARRTGDAIGTLGCSCANLLHNSETGHGLRPHPSFVARRTGDAIGHPRLLER